MVTLNGLVLGGFLVLGAATCRAQGVYARAAAPADTATAIKRLFRMRRQELAGMGLAVGCGSVAPGAAATTPAEGGRMVLPPVATAGLGTNCSLHRFFAMLRFSPKREQQVLTLLALHQPLPAYVRRSLAPVLAIN